MTQDEIRALAARLDPATEVRFTPEGRTQVFAGDGLSMDGLGELLRAAPDAQVAFGFTPLWADALRAASASEPTGPSYELDDLEEDGTWKPGRKPAGWGELP